MAMRLSARAPADSGEGSNTPTTSAPTTSGTTIAAGTRRAATTLLDQGFSSASNFAVGVAVARVAGPAGLGAFAFAYAAWLVLADLHRAFITDPMAIEGDGRQRGRGAIKRGFAAEVVLGSAAAVVFFLVGAALQVVHAHTFATAMMYLAPWLPVLLLQDYWRCVSFMRQQPGRALANDTAFNCVQGAAFVAVFVTHTHSVAAVVTAWGLGGLAGALYGLYQYRVLPTIRGGYSLMRGRWGMSRWLAATSLTGWGSSQAYVYVAGAILGPAGLGGLKAAQALVAGPAGVLIQAGGSIGLPEASNAYAARGWRGLIKVSRIVTAAGVTSFAAGAVMILFWGRDLLSRIYGPSFAHMEGVAVLMAVAYIFMGLSVGPVLVLKQTRNAHRILYTQIVTLVVSLGSVAVLTLRFGVTGTAGATIATYVVAAASIRWYQHVVRRTEADLPPAPPEDPTAESAPWSPDLLEPAPISAVAWWRVARLRRRLQRPNAALRSVEGQLRAHLESTGRGALALVEVNAAGPAALALAALARSLASEGKEVVVADAADGRPLGALLGDRAGMGAPHTVSIDGHPVELLVAPDDPAEMGGPEPGWAADAVLLLATADPAFGAGHIAAWARDAVVMVQAGRVSTTWIEAVRQQLDVVGVTIRSAVLVGADADHGEDHLGFGEATVVVPSRAQG